MVYDFVVMGVIFVDGGVNLVMGEWVVLVDVCCDIFVVVVLSGLYE